MPRIFDNQTEQLAPALRETLGQALAVDACVGYLNLRGWRQIAEQIDQLPGVPGRAPARVLVGMAARPEHLMRGAYRIRRPDEDGRITLKDAAKLRDEALREFREQLVVGAPSDAQERELRRFRTQLVEGKVCVKFFARYPLHAKLYLGHLVSGQVIPHLGFLGSSNLTFSGLVGQGELNVDVTEHDATAKLLSWFEDRWGDDLAVDVTDDLIAILDESWVSETQPDPFILYLKLAYELSSDAREGLRDYDIPASLRGILLAHQADAVRVAARIVERRGGVMVGDVVGLGKTLVATAVARVMYEQHNAETLVICPKNLVRMWKDHFREYQIVGDVVSLSMVHTELEDLARFRLLIVDESHNLRNSETRQWQAVRSYIERNDPRVLLLTATPYNKAFTDAAGQLRLWLSDDADLGVRPERMISDQGELAVAKRADGRLTTLKAFESSLYAEDWQRLMSLFLVRRTRRFVEHRYGEPDAEGRRFLRFADGTAFYFPQRIPRPLPYAGGPDDPGDRLASPDTVDQLNALVLPRYRLVDFLIDGAQGQTTQERQVLERLVKSRGNLLGFIRTTLMKRLASCGPSFLVSVERHLLRNHVTLHALIEGLELPIGTVEGRRWEDMSDDQDPSLEGLELDTGSAVGRTPAQWTALAANRHQALRNKPPSKLTWIDARFFDTRLREALEADIAILQAILNEHGPWDPTKDSKITALAGLISGEHQGEKVLVFSEYADTAEYVAAQLVNELQSTPIAAVTGDTDNPTAMARRFSPASNSALGGLPAGAAELRVLVATDVLSEGQNLQDAAVVVNYDLPWTIIRLIQRAGRVDRIGQTSPTVRVYSFLPQTGVEQVIQLRSRIGARLRENAAVFGSDEQFFEDDLTEDDLKGLFDGTRSLDEDEVDEDVDWASQALAIWESATEEQQQQAMSLPDVIYSTRERRQENDAGGTLVYTRTSRGIDGLAFTEPSAAAPISRILTPYEALRIAITQPGEMPPIRRSDHHELVERAVSTVLLDSARQPLAITHSGPRARLYRILNGYREKNSGTFFDTPELRKLIEAVLHTPLKETAKHRIAKALRERTPDDVVALALDLDEQSGLLIDMDSHDDDIRIVCSLGIPDA
ncbi:MAG: helicase-related protein [Solirubrobacteraceae bacterium]